MKLSILVAACLLGAGLTKVSAQNTAQAVLETVFNEQPQIRNGRVLLPHSPDDKYNIVIGGSSNESVITPDGNVYTPLEAMDVHLLYKVVSKTDKNDTAMFTKEDVIVTVPGKYTKKNKDNPRPKVLPAIREWKGTQGVFHLKKQSRIVVNNPILLSTGEEIQYYLQNLIHRKFSVVLGKPVKGDLYFCVSNRTDLGKEGYSIEISDFVAIEAATPVGNLYAATTLTQIFSQDKEHDQLPKGYIRDYPAYQIRACMLDVARFYVPLNYLEEITKFMAYFKINEVQLHINDDGGEQNAAFRVESKKYPSINSGLKKHEIYSQDAYRQYQKVAARFGIDVITEIDAPAHCRFVALYDTSYMLDDSHINLKNDEAVGFIQKLYDEFLDGDDPVFQSKNFHIGADEYHRGTKYGEDFNNYVNKMIRYIRNKKLQPRMWASLGAGGLVGTSPVSNDVISNYWAYSWADFDKMIKDGFRCINNSHDLYVVPGLRTGYDDYFKLKKMYCSWETTDLSGGWPVLSPAYPLLLGCQASIWYDKKVGISEFDYFDRLKSQVVFICEKGWFGPMLEQQTAEGFMKRVNVFISKVPGINPARQVESKTDCIASYKFKKVHKGIVKDYSANRYNATIDKDLQLQDGTLILNGKGAMHLPFKAVGYPYTLSMNLYLSDSIAEKAVLFQGQEGTLFLNYDGKGNIGYERKGYRFILPYKVPTKSWHQLSFICDQSDLRLYIDGVFVAQGRYLEDTGFIPDSSTFVLPVSSIGSGFKGKIKNFMIFNKDLKL